MKQNIDLFWKETHTQVTNMKVTDELSFVYVDRSTLHLEKKTIKPVYGNWHLSTDQMLKYKFLLFIALNIKTLGEVARFKGKKNF